MRHRQGGKREQHDRRTSGSEWYLDVRPDPVLGRLHRRLHGRRAVLRRVPYLRGEPRRDGSQGHGAGVEHRRRQRPARRAPRIAGLLRGGDVSRALLRGRSDRARRQRRDGRGHARDQGQPRTDHPHGDDHRPRRRSVGQQQARPLAGGLGRQERGRPHVERPAPRGRLDARRRGRPEGDALLRAAGKRVVVTILGIAGSLRAGSHNTQLLRLAAEELPEGVELVVFDGLAEIPAFDQDLEDLAPDAVDALKAAIAEADGILIATPEYNGSIPGALKNALDWVSRPIAESPIRRKPVAVIGASTSAFGAVWAQRELKKVLGVMGARVLDVELPVAKADRALLGADEALLDGLARVVSELVTGADIERIAA